jgi:hypothetical protein
MNQIAALYVGRQAREGGDVAHQVSRMQAQMVACRVYAAARGFFVREAFAAGPGREPWIRNTSKLLERVQVNPALALEEQLHVLVLYASGALGATAGGEDALARLLRLSGVRVEAVQPPHVVAEAGGPGAEAWQEFARPLFFGAPVLQEARTKPAAPPEALAADEAVWRSFLTLLHDEQRLRGAIAAQQQEDDQGLPAQREQLEDARRQESLAEWRMGELLDLLLDRKISEEAFSSQARSLAAELRDRRLARRRAHAVLAGRHPTPQLVDRIVLTAAMVAPALECLPPAERQRAAGFFQLRSEPAQGGQSLACLLPLVDDSVREAASWSVKPRQGCNELGLTVPPLGGSEADPEDFLLGWRLAGAAAEAGTEAGTEAGAGAGAGLGLEATSVLVGEEASL